MLQCHGTDVVKERGAKNVEHGLTESSHLSSWPKSGSRGRGQIAVEVDVLRKVREHLVGSTRR